MKVERFTVSGCCGQTSTTLKIDRPLTEELITVLQAHGFIEDLKFRKAGLYYATESSPANNPALVLTAPLGSNKLTVKCKLKDCAEKLNEFEELLRGIS